MAVISIYNISGEHTNAYAQCCLAAYCFDILPIFYYRGGQNTFHHHAVNYWLKQNSESIPMRMLNVA